MSDKEHHQSTITSERHRRALGHLLTVEDWEESEQAEDAARDALHGLNALGTAGSECQPSQLNHARL